MKTESTTSAPTVGSSAMVRLSLKCVLAHWLACRIDWLERKGARFNSRFRGTFQHQANLGPLSRFKLWLGNHWTREYIEKRCSRR